MSAIGKLETVREHGEFSKITLEGAEASAPETVFGAFRLSWIRWGPVIDCGCVLYREGVIPPPPPIEADTYVGTRQLRAEGKNRNEALRGLMEKIIEWLDEERQLGVLGEGI